MSSISAQVGGIVGVSAPGILPRNSKQVVTFKKKVKYSSNCTYSIADDELFVVMQRAYSDDAVHKFTSS